MSQSLIITTKKDNMLEFEAEVRGIKDPKMSIQFVIQAEEMNLAIPAKHVKEHTWSVNIPGLSFLKHKEYPYLITVDLEGYHFEPMEGELTVVGELEPSVSKPERKEEKKEEKKPEVKKEEPKVEEKPEPKAEPKVEPKVEEKPEEDEEEKKEVKEESDIDRLAASIIHRETLRKSPKDVAARKVLGEIKQKKEEPIVEQPAPVTMEDVLTPEEIARIERDKKVKAILGQVKNR